MTNRLHAIIRRTHCQGTHHRFAIDALPMIRSDAGKRFTAWLLYYHRSFLRGAIDPDVRFRDYQNHILHVREGYWGALHGLPTSGTTACKNTSAQNGSVMRLMRPGCCRTT